MDPVAPYAHTSQQISTNGSFAYYTRSLSFAFLLLCKRLLFFCTNLVTRAKSAYLHQISAFIDGAIAAGAALAFVVKNAAAMGVGADFDAPEIIIGQQIGERGDNLRLHPIPIFLEPPVPGRIAYQQASGDGPMGP